MVAVGEEEQKKMEKTEMPVAREEKILVLVRLRPLNEKEIAANEAADWECINDTTVLYRNTLREGSNFPSTYSFDRVYGGECPTRQVYEDGTKEIALSVVKGINCSVFAYGQTSSGKTYTMTAITQFAVADIFDYIFQHEERAFSVKFSAIEIYNEAIRDLLSSDGTSLRLRDDPEKGTVVEKATEETLRDWNHLKELLSVCEVTCCPESKLSRYYNLCSTAYKDSLILSLALDCIVDFQTVESSAREFVDKENSTTLVATVSFIDLAGSERASQAMSAGARLKEGCHINRSLLTLGTVIRKLSKGRQGHINFRDSKLTRILQPCLGGNSRTAIICTLSPARSHVELTRNTLLFARCAKEVTTKARINVVMSDKALLKQLQRELARLETELRNPASPASNCDCAMTVRKKDLLIQKMEKQIAELRKQRDLAQSRLEDFMRMVEHDEASKSGTPHFGNHTDKWEDDSDTRSFISDRLSTPPLSRARAYVRSPSDEDDLDEELPRRSEDPSEEYCREVQCIEIEESATVYYNNHKDERAEPNDVLGRSADANGETSVGQNVRMRSWNQRETVPGTSTPPESLGTDFLGRHKIVFPDLEFGSSVSRNDSMSSFGSDSTGAQGIRTPLGEEGGITSIRTFVEGFKDMAKRQGEVSNAEGSGKMGRHIGVDSMDMEFERQRQEILELWQTCNVSLVHRTYFYLLFKGDQADSIYIGVELRRLMFMKDRFSQGNQALEGGETFTLASSRKALHRERKMLSKLVGKRFSGEERTRIYHKFGIAVNSKRRRLQLVNELWSNPKDMTQVVESADVVAKLVRFAEQGRAMKEMFGLTFTPPSFLTAQRSHSWRKSMPTLF
ncbi:unnamed protein product [Thlaspi arvense]|uniref:Kinesin-like protein n=1 Tax=Thlaspi arvense TaxID=13288 RepID=A0AAU9SY18_THLAR|nr:unnamed protein product [Thlaspi arvense]